MEPSKLLIGGLPRSLVPLTRLASFTGQIISTAPVLGNIARIMTRHCLMSTLSTQHWDSKVKMDPYCIDEVYFWKNNLSSIKVPDCFLFNKPQCFAYSDANANGCSSVITLNENCVCHKLWEPAECSKSSTWRELAAIVFALESFVPILEGSLVKWFTDRIIEVGSMKLDLHRLAIKIFQFCTEHSIRLEVQWIPRTCTENEKADYISRLIDFDDWQITHDLFLSLEELWGPHTVDCFANYYTAKFVFLESRCVRNGLLCTRVKFRELLSGSSGCSCCSHYPLSETAESDAYSCSPIMAFVQFLAYSDEQIAIVH